MSVLSMSAPGVRRSGSTAGLALRTLALAVLRGALLDLLATNDMACVSAGARPVVAAGLWRDTPRLLPMK
jgi:hypothetical protein